VQNVVDDVKDIILVVEDDDAYRYVLTRELRASGLDVFDFRLASQALDHLDRDPAIRKALIDCQPPANEITGLRFAHLMRRRNSRARIVLMTGHPDYLEMDEARQFGGVLLKMADASVMAATVRERLGFGAAPPGT
jgi:DNA-binding NtrC family response regulator